MSVTLKTFLHCESWWGLPRCTAPKAEGFPLCQAHIDQLRARWKTEDARRSLV